MGSCVSLTWTSVNWRYRMKSSKEPGAASAQRDKFEAAARELGTDNDPERFKALVQKIGGAKPSPGPIKAPRTPKPDQ